MYVRMYCKHVCTVCMYKCQGNTTDMLQCIPPSLPSGPLYCGPHHWWSHPVVVVYPAVGGFSSGPAIISPSPSISSDSHHRYLLSSVVVSMIIYPYYPTLTYYMINTKLNLNPRVQVQVDKKDGLPLGQVDKI